MSFSIVTVNGVDIIRQSGTDTNLSGITNFTHYNNPPVNTSLGFALGWTGQKIYFIDKPLEIIGSLSWDSYEEMLVSSANFPDGNYTHAIKVTGSSANLVIGTEIGTNLDGSPRYSKGIGMVLGFDFNNSQNALDTISKGGFIVESGGSMTVNGSEIQLASPLIADSSLTDSDSIVFNETIITDISPFSLGKQTVRNEANSDVVKYNNISYDSKNNANRFINIKGIDNFSGKFLNSFIQPHRSDTGAPPVGGKVTLENISFGSNYNSFDVQLVGDSTTDSDNQAVEITNVDIGTGVRPNQVASGSVNHFSIFQKVKTIVQDTSFNPIQGCKVRIPTTDSGNRNNTLIGGQFIGDLDFEEDNYDEYTSVTNSNGESAERKILIGRFWNDDLSSSTITYDLYGKSQVPGEDKFDREFRSYLHNYNSTESVFKSNSSLVFKTILTLDTNITETDKAIVDSYTDLGSAKKVYDCFKSEWLDLTLDSLILDRLGDQIDLDKEATSLVIDATALNSRNFTGTIATIKASTFTGGALTNSNGSVTTKNGSLLNGGTFDCNVNYQSGANTTLTNVTVNEVVDFNTAGSYTLDGCTISEVTNSSSGNITITLLNGASINTNTGPNITLSQPAIISNQNIVDQSRVQIINTTKSIKLDNSIVIGSNGYSSTVNLLSSDADIGDFIKLKATYQVGTTAKKPLELTGVLTSNGLTFIDSQEDLSAYSSLGVDGSLVTEYNLDQNNIQIDGNDVDGISTKKRIVARYYYLITTADGIDRFFNHIELEDEGNAVVNRDVSNLMVDNIGNNQITLIDSDFRLYTSDGSPWILLNSTGGYGITADSGKVYVKGVEELEEKVQRVVDLEEADIFTTPNTFTKKKKSEDIILHQKNFVTDNKGTESLTEA